MILNFPAEENQWLLKRRKQLPQEPWPTLHKVFLFGNGLRGTMLGTEIPSIAERLNPSSEGDCSGRVMPAARRAT